MKYRDIFIVICTSARMASHANIDDFVLAIMGNEDTFPK